MVHFVDVGDNNGKQLCNLTFSYPIIKCLSYPKLGTHLVQNWKKKTCIFKGQIRCYVLEDKATKNCGLVGNMRQQLIVVSYYPHRNFRTWQFETTKICRHVPFRFWVESTKRCLKQVFCPFRGFSLSRLRLLKSRRYNWTGHMDFFWTFLA